MSVMEGGVLAPVTGPIKRQAPVPDWVYFSMLDECLSWPGSLQKQARPPLDLSQADALARALPETGDTALIRRGEGYVVECEVPGVSKPGLAKYLSLAQQFDVELNIHPETRDDDNVLLLEFAR